MRYHALSQPYNFGAETHLGGGDASAFVVPSARSLSSTLVASTVLRKPHKDSDHTAVIAVIRRCSYAETHCAGEAVSAVIIKFLSSLWTPLPTQSTERGPHLTCVNWNELQHVACTTMELSPVASRLPGVRLPLVIRQQKCFCLSIIDLFNKKFVSQQL